MIQEPNNQTPDLFTFRGPMLEECDLPRLNTAARRVWDAMLLIQETEVWCDLNAIADELGLPHSTVTACVRGFRNDENGGHKVETMRRKAGKGTWLYQLWPNSPDGIAAARERAASAKAKGTPSHRQGRVDALLELKDWIVLNNTLKGGWWLHQDGKDILAKIDLMVKEVDHA